MKQKIEWYQEILELEPGSRAFFPLAKLLVADSRTQDAIAALRRGLTHHPNHVEAKLFLVDLLFSQNPGVRLDAEIEELAALFSGYSGFWSAWSARLAQTPGMQDAALALRFFCASLRGMPLTWAVVIEQGLQTALGPVTAFPSRPLAAQELETPEGFSSAPPSPPEKTGPVTLDAPEQREDEDEEIFSLRTRTMADVLAEQGDIVGALDIYRELKNSASGDSAGSLQARIDELTRRMSASPSTEAAEENQEPSAGMEGGRLVLLLESLAQRLEARAR